MFWEILKGYKSTGGKGGNRLAYNINIVELFYAFNYISVLIEMMLIALRHMRGVSLFSTCIRIGILSLAARNKTAWLPCLIADLVPC